MNSGELGDPANGTDANPASPWHGPFAIGLIVGVLLAGAGTATRLVATAHWRFELASHFPLQLAIATGLAAIGLVLLRRWVFAAMAVGTCAVNVGLVGTLFVPAAAPVEPVLGPTLRCISANVHRTNREHAPLVAFLRRERPDVVVLLESNATWEPALADLQDLLPHRQTVARTDAFGVVLLSRYPLTDVRSVTMSDRRLPTLVATISVEGRSVTLVGAHPVPPMGRGPAGSRNEHLAELAALVSLESGPVVLMGDLNITPWSPYFERLLADGRLRDARRGFGVHPTWPALPWPVRIPIDHVLVSPTIEVVDFRVGPHIGSDHRPVLADVRLP